MRPHLGLLIALPVEAQALLGRRGWQRQEVGRIHQGTLAGGVAYTCLCCGPGWDRARTGARFLVTRGASALGVLGVAGGLHPQLGPGELLLADEVLDGGDESSALRCDSGLLKQLQEDLTAAGLRVHRGPLLSRREAVLTAAAKGRLHQVSGAWCVDMESAPVARIASETALPFWVLRSVSDGPQQTLSPLLGNLLDSEGGVRWTVLAGALLRRPSLIAELLRLRRNLALALDALGRAWEVQRNSPPLPAGAISPADFHGQVNE